MPLVKRKRPAAHEPESDDESSSFSVVAEDSDVDISSALVGKRPKLNHELEPDDNEELTQFLRASIAKRSIKDGTQVLKSSKGKAKIAKGEVGGGSFQSMGKRCIWSVWSFGSDSI
jgi:ATP-dependent RNA helicase DDX54/DBP10